MVRDVALGRRRRVRRGAGRGRAGAHDRARHRQGVDDDRREAAVEALFHAGHWWAVLPSKSAKPAGTWLWRLEADNHWKNVLRLSSSTKTKADAKAVGDVTHVLLHGGSP
ncbi:MAG: hypothetical protein E6J56_04335 [Deltaproteobacteria bacterium]|nr:MAG: hypothetical protein E6J56_04335 [Deltaproteobacteria bacterium]